MAKFTVKLDSKKNTKSAQEIFEETLEAGICEDTGALQISYATCKEQGYGSQTFDIKYTEDIISALKGYAENGVPEFIPSAEMDPVQSLHDSIKKMPDGTISYKQSGKRGSKSCMFANEKEFVAFVKDAETRLPLIKSALESAYEEMQNAENAKEDSDEESVSEE